ERTLTDNSKASDRLNNHNRTLPMTAEMPRVSSMRRYCPHARIVVALLSTPIVAITAQQTSPASAAPSIRIPFEKYTLPNGLTVILSEDHTTPTIAAEVIYHVGSKNEVVGHTGFAHMFEHVM